MSPQDRPPELPTPIKPVVAEAVPQAPVPPQTRPATIIRRSTTTVSREEVHIGPIPSPETFAGYERVLPGSAERILTMAENEQKNRHYVARGTITTERLGLAAAFTIAMTVIGGGVYLAIIGRDLTGVGTIFLGLAGLVSVFFRGGRKPPSPPIPK